MSATRSRQNSWYGRGFAIVYTCLSLLICGPGCTETRKDITAVAEKSESSKAIDTFTLLDEATHHEALFTLVGGLKPMSTGIWAGSFTVDDPDLADLRSVRSALAPLRNDIWYADVLVFDHIFDGQRGAQVYVVHRAALARMIERLEDFWGQWGISPCTHPSEVVAVVDRMPMADRWRGFGYLFGYPADAVEFFVQAGILAEDGREVGLGKDRKFIQIPTLSEDTGRFTYAVRLGHVRTELDHAIARGAKQILAAFIRSKEKMTSTQMMIAELYRLNQRFERGVVSGTEASRNEQLRERKVDTKPSFPLSVSKVLWKKEILGLLAIW